MPPLKLAVVGGGPSAFYVASRLLQLLPPTHARADDLRIHIYDQLWAPYGLVRYGVAPDHPDVKNCTHKFDAAARDPRVRFFGNVHIASTPAPALPHALLLPLPSLLSHYTHLLLATGAPVPRTLPHLPHARPAISLVHWYTAHPTSPAPPAPPPLPPNTQHLTLIGLGNVVLDIARILLTPPSRLAHLDIPAHVLDELTRTWRTLRHIAIVGRRGPREARWAPKELRELLGLTHARMAPVDSRVLDDAAAEGGALTRQESRVLQLLRAGSTAVPPSGAPKSFSLDFWRAPVAHADAGRTLVLADTRTHAPAAPAPLRTDAVFASLGFRGDAAPWARAGWFDADAWHLRHAHARVLTPAGEVVRNVYAAGWAAHGARGVIAGTLLDARAVAARIVGDHYGAEHVGEGVEREAEEDEEPRARVEVMRREVDKESVPEEVRRGVADGRVPGWAQWDVVEQEERRRGEERGKERERMGWEEARAFLSEKGHLIPRFQQT